MGRKKIIAVMTAIAAFALLVTGCDLEPDPADGVSRDGIVMYSGNEILNGKKWEIVTNRVQQLRATGPSGHAIIWSSSDPQAVDVNQTGLLRVGRSPNKEAVISAASSLDPSIKAEVTFKTKGLR